MASSLLLEEGEGDAEEEEEEGEEGEGWCLPPALLLPGFPARAAGLPRSTASTCWRKGSVRWRKGSDADGGDVFVFFGSSASCVGNLEDTLWVESSTTNPWGHPLGLSWVVAGSSGTDVAVLAPAPGRRRTARLRATTLRARDESVHPRQPLAGHQPPRCRVLLLGIRERESRRTGAGAAGGCGGGSASSSSTISSSECDRRYTLKYGGIPRSLVGLPKD